MEKTNISLNKKHLKIIINHLQNNNYTFQVNTSEQDFKAHIEIDNLNPEDAFYLGVNTQVQLLEGEILI